MKVLLNLNALTAQAYTITTCASLVALKCATSHMKGPMHKRICSHLLKTASVCLIKITVGRI